MEVPSRSGTYGERTFQLLEVFASRHEVVDFLSRAEIRNYGFFHSRREEFLEDLRKAAVRNDVRRTAALEYRREELDDVRPIRRFSSAHDHAVAGRGLGQYPFHLVGDVDHSRFFVLLRRNYAKNALLVTNRWQFQMEGFRHVGIVPIRDFESSRPQILKLEKKTVAFRITRNVTQMEFVQKTSE